MKLDKGDLSDFNTIMQQEINDIARKFDKFLFDKFDTIDNKYVGYRLKESLPVTNNTNWNNYTVKCSMCYEFIGFDTPEELIRYLKEGYSIVMKSDLEKYRDKIK
jgi:hypothetical protein